MAAEARVVGWLGLLLFSAASLLALWRTVVLFRVQPGLWPLSARKWFHVGCLAMFVANTFDYAWMAAHGDYIDYSRGTFARVCYGLHMYALWLLLAVLSIVISLWAEALSGQRRRVRMPLVVLNVGVFVTATYLNALLLGEESREHTLEWFANNNAAYGIFLYILVVVMALLSGGLLYQGRSIAARIDKAFVTPSEHLRRMVTNVNASMTIVCTCFTVRVGFLALMAVWGQEHASAEIPDIVWYPCEEWIPTLVPAGLLLYLMRKTEPSGGGGRGAPLLSA